MSDLGFEHLSMEPVVGEEGDYVLREEDWPALEKEYEKLADTTSIRWLGREV